MTSASVYLLMVCVITIRWYQYMLYYNHNPYETRTKLTLFLNFHNSFNPTTNFEFFAMSSSDEAEYYGVTKLVECSPLPSSKNGAIDFQAFFENDGCEEMEAGEYDTAATHAYEAARLNLVLKFDDEISENDDEDDYEGPIKTFVSFRKKMMPLIPSGHVLKMIEREGNGNEVPSLENCYVRAHYAVWNDLSNYPFDASKLRQPKPVKLYLDSTTPGLKIALCSMKIGERSKFLIHYDYAYKEFGVMERIPPESTLLYDIEIFDWKESTVRGKETTFKMKLDKIKRVITRGNMFKKKIEDNNAAIKTYYQALRKLLALNSANAEEYEMIEYETLRLYRNLAICFLDEKSFAKVCRCFHDSEKVNKAKTNEDVKILCCFGKALRELRECKEAITVFQRLVNLNPNSSYIKKELNETLKAQAKTYELDKKMFVCMFGAHSTLDDVGEKFDRALEEFRKNFWDLMTDFKEGPQDEFVSESIYTASELDIVREVCKKRNLVIRKCGPIVRIGKKCKDSNFN